MIIRSYILNKHPHKNYASSFLFGCNKLLMTHLSRVETSCASVRGGCSMPWSTAPINNITISCGSRCCWRVLATWLVVIYLQKKLLDADTVIKHWLQSLLWQEENLFFHECVAKFQPVFFFLNHKFSPISLFSKILGKGTNGGNRFHQKECRRGYLCHV